MTPEQHDIVTEIRTGTRWVVIVVEGDRLSVVRRGELGKVHNVLRPDEVEVTR